MEKKDNIYFCNVHVSIVSTYKAAVPVPHATAQAYIFVLLSSHSGCIRKMGFLWQLYGLLGLCTAQAGVKHDRCMLKFGSVTTQWKGRLQCVDNWLIPSGIEKKGKTKVFALYLMHCTAGTLFLCLTIGAGRINNLCSYYTVNLLTFHGELPKGWVQAKSTFHTEVSLPTWKWGK